MPTPTKWNFAADYITQCNCDWGCPCNFNARPNQGNCHGAGAWRITRGTFDGTKLDGVVFAAAYFFPGLIEQGGGTARLYVDARATAGQRKAIEAIHSGKHGGGIFEVFPQLVSNSLPTMVAKIDFRFDGASSGYRVDGIMELECEPIKYPDGMVISPTFTLPHGIEFKSALAASAKTWWIRDETMLAHHANKYAAIAHVKFNNKGCVG